MAVVGTFGKSTTMRAIAAVLHCPVHSMMMANAWSAVAGAVLRIAPSQRHAVIEVGIANVGQMKPYATTVRPDIAVVTCIGSEHHRSLGTLDVTRDEKAWMVRVLRRDGVAVLNGDDPNVMWMRGETAARVVTYGYGEGCDVRASNYRLDWPGGSRFDVVAFGEAARDVAVRFLSRPLTYPALAALAVARVQGIALADAIADLRDIAPTTGRMEAVSVGNGVTFVRDDYKGALETFLSALEAFEQIPARRRIVVLGDITEPPSPQRLGYRIVGTRAAEFADRLVIVGQMHEAYSVGARRAGMP